MPPKKKRAASVSSSESSSTDSAASSDDTQYSVYVVGNVKLLSGQAASPAEILDFPTKEASFTELGVTARQSAGGLKHIVILADDGRVYGWGSNSHGQLGLDPKKVPYCYQWTLIKQLSNKKVSKVSCGANHTLALTQLGMVFAFGANNHGQLGTTLTKIMRFEPQTVPKVCLVKDIAGGGDASYAVDKTGDLFMWGHNKNGMCGVPEFGGTVVEKPKKIPTFEELGNEVEAVTAGPYHVVVRSGAQIYTFGCGEYGKLGTGDIFPRKEPTEVEVSWEKGESVPDITCSGYATLLLSHTEKKNQIVSTLRGFGKLSDAGDESILEPREIQIPTTSKIIKTGAAKGCQMLMTEEGELYSWGASAQGLFQKHVEGSKRTVPQRVTMLEGKFVSDFVMAQNFTMIFVNEGKSEKRGDMNTIPVFGRYYQNPGFPKKKFTYETCKKRFELSCEANKLIDNCSEASYDGPTREVVGASNLKLGDEISLWVQNVWAWATIREIHEDNKFTVEWERNDWKQNTADIDLESENEDVDCESPNRWTYGFYSYWDSESSSSESTSSDDDEDDASSNAESGKSDEEQEKSKDDESQEEESSPPAKKKRGN
eukprot:TRINITY_DN19300_c0_g1_i1.p1 TRINITY_DN19300_c0_g1~~TRINITY_DN19300_c0_g1_i1.p1  ORF type:complete len:599 (+),score=155.12 TRINITY_DN19300_c0_g1_i1:52-1848(+)